MGGLPEALFIIDVGNEKIAIREAKRLSIPIVGIVDTNNNPEGVDFPIPGNDDALRAIRFYCKTLADAIIEARGVLELTTGKPEETQPVKAKVKVKKVVKKTAGEEAETEEPAAEEEPTVASKLEKAAAANPTIKAAIKKKPAKKTEPADREDTGEKPRKKATRQSHSTKTSDEG